MDRENEKDIEVSLPPIPPKIVEKVDKTRHPIALVMTFSFIGVVYIALLAAIIFPNRQDGILAMTRELMGYVVPVLTLIYGFYFAKRK